MIPILYEAGETTFISNGIGRLRDCISCTVSEERNGIFECQFEMATTAAHFDDVRPGRIIAVTHDDTGDVQPFDIVGMSRPISGIVTFHAVHISYRLTGSTVYGSNINSLADALTLMGTATPTPAFTFTADYTSNAYMAAADGTPRSVRQFLGGIEGSILDSYGGEYEWDRFNVILHKARGQARDFSIRYGVNMTNYQEETDYQGAYTSCIPYWTGSGDNGNPATVIGNKVDSGAASYNGRDICVPLDLTDKFETKPTGAQLRAEAASRMAASQTHLPAQTIDVDFIRLQDMPEYQDLGNLLQCQICDTINVVFPYYNTSGRYKIVKTTYDVLGERFTEMQLGSLAPTLSEALGITTALEKTNGIDQVSNDYAELYRGGFTAGTTAARITGLTINVGNGDCFTVGTNQVTIKKSGAYFISVSFVQSATNNATNVKRLALYRNGSSLHAALTRGSSWNTVTADAIYTLTAGDIMTMYARDESGTGTYSYGRCILMPLNV